MRITYLGHAGFLVETAEAVVVTDPWLSPQGAFDSAWMQLPRNHHLAPWVRERLQDPARASFVYLSHEHQDHFDPGFLASLRRKDVTLVVPRFARTALIDTLSRLGFEKIIACHDGQVIPIPGGSLRMFLTDSGLNRDSAVWIKAGGRSFLNLNDCKLHDRLPRLASEEGSPDVFTAQFSGAIWHPTCYRYEREAYEAISRKKQTSKFEAVARALDALKPRAYVASAGPVAFLDPKLEHLNFERINIFPRASQFFPWLTRRMKNQTPKLAELMPGDVLDAGSLSIDARGTERFTDETFSEYIRGYQRDLEPLFRARRRNLMQAEVDLIHSRLGEELGAKLAALRLRERIKVPLYVALEERPRRVLRVDFRAGTISEVERIAEEPRHVCIVAAADVQRVLERKMTWEELMLSFRVKLERTPDDYDAILHGFLAGETHDLADFCRTVEEAESRKDERIEVSAGGRTWSVRRFCPHQGADLTQAWIEEGHLLVCPRHRWQFDLEREGMCTGNDTSIEAMPCGGCEAPGGEEAPVVAGSGAEAVAGA